MFPKITYTACLFINVIHVLFTFMLSLNLVLNIITQPYIDEITYDQN